MHKVHGMSNHGAIFHPVKLGDGNLTVAVKDCIDIAGLPTKGGCAALDDAPPAVRHADVVAQILKAGCQIVGKANMHELAYGVTGLNVWTGSPVNPRFPERVPGGSSSGSAVAVAEGLVDFSIGTDTGGSIRTPAACCGVYGLKPSFGRVSRAGALPQQSSLDCVGPLARSMSMIEAAMSIIAPGYSPIDLTGLRYAVVRLRNVDVAVQQAFDAVVAMLGEPAAMVQLSGIEGAYTANISVISAETYATFGHLVESGQLGSDVEARLRASASVDADRLAHAQQVRATFGEEIDGLLSDYDVLLLPTMPCFPLRVADAGDSAAALRMTALVRPFNLTGHPALTIPVLAKEGLPIGIQVVGRRGQDEAVCAFGRMVESKIPTITKSAEEELKR